MSAYRDLKLLKEMAGPAGKAWKLGTVTSTDPLNVQIDGEADDAGITYPALASYPAAIEDKVLLARVGATWVVLGEAGTPATPSYYEIVNADTTQSFTSGTAAILTNLQVPAGAPDLNDYPASAFNLATGVWTCPDTGLYDVTFYANISSWVAGARFVPICRVNGSTVIQNEYSPAGTFAGGMIAGTLPLLDAGDAVTFLVDQFSGVAKTLSTATYISIAKRRL